jgi:type II secretory pathway pseudopilin PulG
MSRIARRRRANRDGFNLLEVILALSILTGAIAVLGEVNRLSLRNATYAREMTQAQLLCESKMAEITAGILLPEQVTGAQFDVSTDNSLDTTIDDSQVQWVYSIERDTVDDEGLLWVKVTVEQDPPDPTQPIDCSLVRWIIDPDVVLAEQTAAETAAAAAESSASGGSSASGAGGGSGGSP